MTDSSTSGLSSVCCYLQTARCDAQTNTISTLCWAENKWYLSRNNSCLQANLIPIAENRGPRQSEEQQLVESEELSRYGGCQESCLRHLEEDMPVRTPSPQPPPSTFPTPISTVLTLQPHQRLPVAFKYRVTSDSVCSPVKLEFDRYELVNSRSLVDSSILRICWRSDESVPAIRSLHKPGQENH